MAIRNLCRLLDIDANKPGWREQLAPFAPVLAAMINASAATSTPCAVCTETMGSTHTAVFGKQLVETTLRQNIPGPDNTKH